MMKNEIEMSPTKLNSAEVDNEMVDWPGWPGDPDPVDLGDDDPADWNPAITTPLISQGDVATLLKSLGF